MEETSTPSPSPKEKEINYNKTTSENEIYSLKMKTKKNNSIYMSITFEKEDKVYEDCKLYDEIKKEQSYFEDYSLSEFFDEISNLISKNSVELIKNEDYIIYSIILPFKKKRTIDFVLEIPKENMDISIFQKIIKQKDEIIREKDKIIKEKNEIIEIIADLKEIISKLTGKNINDIKTKENNENEENDNPNEIFKDFNIVNLTPENILTDHGDKEVTTILELQDGRLASGGGDGNIIIYNKETLKPELTISEHTKEINDLIQLKNGNLMSCSDNDKTMNLYQLIENNKYKLLSQVKVQEKYYPMKIRELENGEIGLVAYDSIFFYLNKNNKFDEDFKITYDENQIGQYRNMISVKPGELVICGQTDKIQFFELNSRKLKEIININRDICWTYDNLLCMMNERYLCVGGENKITIIDVYQKNIIREIEDNGVHYCLYKLNDNILLSGKSCDITQWKICQNNLTLISKKEKAHQDYIYKIIKFRKNIVTCSCDKSLKIW